MLNIIEADRTTCDCHKCAAGCKTMPGSLIQSDITNIQKFVGDSTDEFLLSNFLASEGALVLMTIDGETQAVRVPTIVPAQKSDGRCVFLDDNDHCRIHPVAPFGCAYFDMHMNNLEANRRAMYALRQQMASHHNVDDYSKLLYTLVDNGLTASPLSQRRTALRNQLEQLQEST